MTLGQLDPASLLMSVVIFAACAAAMAFGAAPLGALILRREQQFGQVLRGSLLLNVSPRVVTVLSMVGVGLMAFIGYGITGSWLGAAIGGAVGVALPGLVIRLLKRRRLRRLEEQLNGGIQTLASGVRAGLNLVQAMELVGRDGPTPLRQEFAHLLREYDYGVALEEAMDNAVLRIGSSDFSLLFAALQTHRQRGGDLGHTLDRIGESIREIQRLENRIETLTAQGRATARWLGAMPVVVMLIMYFIVHQEGVLSLFQEDSGKLILGGIVMLNVMGFLWIKKIVSIDI